MSKKIIILGAGVSGLSLAWKLSTKGFEVHVLEAKSQVGGLAGTLREGDYCMDIGPHSFFSEDQEILETVLTLFDNKLVPRNRNVKFYYQDKFLDYPLTAYSVLFQMGLWTGIRAGISFVGSKFTYKGNVRVEADDETVEEWAIKSFGRHLYDTFFKPYTEQFWKVPCSELSSRSIPTHTRMSFINTCRILLKRRLTDKKSSLIEREMLPTYYPDTGFAEIPEKIAEAAITSGVQIHVNSRAVSIDNHSNGQLRVRYDTGETWDEITGDTVVGTIPINHLINMLEPSAPEDVLIDAGKLEQRSIVALGMVTERQDVLGCSYIYVLDRPYNRISEMNAFSNATSPEGENILVVEIPCLKDSVVWTASKEELFEICIGALSKDGFLSPGDVKSLLLVKVENAYPIYKKDYVPHLKRALDYIEEFDDIFVLGRAGEHMYMDVDVCIRRAFDLADKMITSYE